MKGVEKGYRLHAAGKPCEPFKIKKIPDSTGLQATPIPVKVHFKGFSQFPVTAAVAIISCPAGWTCSGGTVTCTSPVDSPLGDSFTCNTSSPQPPATFRLRTTLKDVDEVQPEPVEHNLTCLHPAGQRPVPGAPTGRPSLTLSAG